MTEDLFSAGFAWTDGDVSQIAATPIATPADDPFASFEKADWSASAPSVAGVAGVAETEGERLVRQLSQPLVPVVATPVATPQMADFCGSDASPTTGVAGVASVADWADGIDAVRAVRLLPSDREGRRLQRDVVRLMADWGADLHAAGWSTLDVWGSNADPAHRRLDRLGLVHFIMGGQVEAIDSETATIRPNPRDTWTFRRRLVAAGGVPLWLVGSGGESRWEGAGEAPSALPRPPAPCQPASGEGEMGKASGRAVA